MQILDRKEQVLRSKNIPLVKVLRGNYQVEEATWESEDQVKIKYSHLGMILLEFRGRNSQKRGNEL